MPDGSAGARDAAAEDALKALRRRDELSPDPFALGGLRRLLPRVLRADATAAEPLRRALLEAARRVAASV